LAEGLYLNLEDEHQVLARFKRGARGFCVAHPGFALASHLAPYEGGVALPSAG